jgi:hypothetical protein
MKSYKSNWLKISVLLGIVSFSLLTCSFPGLKQNFIDGSVPPYVDVSILGIKFHDIIDASSPTNKQRITIYFNRDMSTDSFSPLHDLSFEVWSASTVEGVNGWEWRADLPQQDLPVHEIVPYFNDGGTVGCPYAGVDLGNYCFNIAGNTIETCPEGTTCNVTSYPEYYEGLWCTTASSCNGDSASKSFVWEKTGGASGSEIYNKLTIFLNPTKLNELLYNGTTTPDPYILRAKTIHGWPDAPDYDCPRVGTHALSGDTSVFEVCQSAQGEIAFLVAENDILPIDLPFVEILQPAHHTGSTSSDVPDTYLQKAVPFPPHEEIFIKFSEPLYVAFPYIVESNTSGALDAQENCEFIIRNQDGSSDFDMDTDTGLRIWRSCGLPTSTGFDLSVYTEDVTDWWSKVKVGSDPTNAYPDSPFGLKFPLSQDWAGTRISRGDTATANVSKSPTGSGVYRETYDQVSAYMPEVVTSLFRSAPVRILETYSNDTSTPEPYLPLWGCLSFDIEVDGTALHRNKNKREVYGNLYDGYTTEASFSIGCIIDDPDDGINIYSCTIQLTGGTAVEDGDSALLRFTGFGDGETIGFDQMRVVFDSGIDSDGDHLLDIDELAAGSDPCVFVSLDGDSLPDYWEDLYACLDSTTQDDQNDPDGDSLTNLEEFNYGLTNPCLADTDHDGLNDDFEIFYLSPSGASISPTSVDTDNDGFFDSDEIQLFSTDPTIPNIDTDHDGLPDAVETNDNIFLGTSSTGTSPSIKDSDGDGVSDGAEALNGSNPCLDYITPGQGFEKIGPFSSPIFQKLDWGGREFGGLAIDHFWRGDRSGTFFVSRYNVYGSNSETELLSDGKNHFVISGQTQSIDGSTVYQITSKVLNIEGEPTTDDIPLAICGNAPWITTTDAGDEIGVAWTCENDIGESKIHFTRIDKQGELLMPPISLIDWGGADSLYPSISWTGSEYGLVWQDDRNVINDIFFTHMQRDGTLIDSSTAILPGSTQDRFYPKLTWADGHYGMVWHENEELYIKEISTDGNSLGASLILGDFSPDTTIEDKNLYLNYSSGYFGVIWHYDRPFMAYMTINFIPADGSTIDSFFELVNTPRALTWAEQALSYGFNFDSYFVIYQMKDLDGDGLLNTEEGNTTDPANWDTDGDQMDDWWEDYYSRICEIYPHMDDRNSNPDGDAYNNYIEYLNNTDPCTYDMSDQDGDGMPDEWEDLYSCVGSTIDDGETDADTDGLSNINEYLSSTDPCNIDTDGDLMDDAWEVSYSATCDINPLINDASDDPDSDGYDNLTEYTNTTDPCTFTVLDLDGDSMPDAWEDLQPCVGSSVDDADLDPDLDGISNINEYLSGTNPCNDDSDGDGMSDGWELAYFEGGCLVDPLTPDADGDLDGDSLSNFEEYGYQTNPCDSDSDSDGLNDSEEIWSYGTDPNNNDTDYGGVPDGLEINSFSTDPNDPLDDVDTVIIGAEETDSSFLLRTSRYEARSQIIYLDSEIGRPGLIEKLALNVKDVPGATVNNFAIRIKETSSDSYSSEISSFESGFSPVFVGDQNITQPGWHVFNLNPPYYYNGTGNLMLDFILDSDDPADLSSNGNCYASSPGGMRSTFYGTTVNEKYGDPWTWTFPVQIPADDKEKVPNLMIKFAIPDQDDDGMPDYWENQFPCMDMYTDNSTSNFDGDSLTDLEEFELGTNPCLVDGDSDGFSDYSELFNSTCLDPNNADTDGDGLCDGAIGVSGICIAGEDLNADLIWGETTETNPCNPDTDGDGASDWLEDQYGADPLVSNSPPIAFEVDPQTAEYGDTVTIFGLNFADTISIVDVEFQTATGNTATSPISTSPTKILFSVPEIFGVSYLQVSRLVADTTTPDIPPLKYKSEPTFFWTPEDPSNQVAEDIPGPTLLLGCTSVHNSTCTSVGKIRSVGENDRYYLDLTTSAMVTISLESVRPEGFSLVSGDTLSPDVYLEVRDSAENLLYSVDNFSEVDNNAYIERIKLDEGEYYLFATSSPNNSSENYEELKGFYRLHTTIETMPIIENINPAVGTSGTEMQISGFNFNPVVDGNTIGFVLMDGFDPVASYGATVLDASTDELTVIVPSAIDADSLGSEYRVQIINDQGDNLYYDSYEDIKFWSFNVLPGEVAEQFKDRTYFDLSGDSVSLVGHTDALTTPNGRSHFGFYAEQGQSFEVDVQFFDHNRVIPSADTPLDIVVKRDYPWSVLDSLTVDTSGNAHYFARFENIPVSGNYGLFVWPESAADNSFFKATVTEVTDNTTVDELVPISGQYQTVFPGVASEPIKVQALNGGAGVNGTKILFKWWDAINSQIQSVVVTTIDDDTTSGVAQLAIIPSDFVLPGESLDIVVSVLGKSTLSVYCVLSTVDMTPPADGDWDGDGCIDAIETNTGVFNGASDMGTDPFDPDTDDDGFNDCDDNYPLTPYQYLLGQTDPSSPTDDYDNDGIPNSADNDDDNDGLPDTEDPDQFNSDTDGDGLSDGWEIAHGLPVDQTNESQAYFGAPQTEGFAGEVYEGFIVYIVDKYGHLVQGAEVQIDVSKGVGEILIDPAQPLPGPSMSPPLLSGSQTVIVISTEEGTIKFDFKASNVIQCPSCVHTWVKLKHEDLHQTICGKHAISISSLKQLFYRVKDLISKPGQADHMVLAEHSTSGYNHLPYTNQLANPFAVQQPGLWAKIEDVHGNAVSNEPITISVNGDGKIVPADEAVSLNDSITNKKIPYFENATQSSIIEETNVHGWVNAELVLGRSQESYTVNYNSTVDSQFITINASPLSLDNVYLVVRQFPNSPSPASEPKGFPGKRFPSPIMSKLFTGDTTFVVAVDYGGTITYKLLEGTQAGYISQEKDGDTSSAPPTEIPISIDGNSTGEIYWWLGDTPASSHTIEICGKYGGDMQDCWTQTAYSELVSKPFESLLHVVGENTRTVPIHGSTVPVVTTDFDNIILTMNNIYSIPLKLRVSHRSRSSINSQYNPILKSYLPQDEGYPIELIGDNRYLERSTIHYSYNDLQEFVYFYFKNADGERLRTWGGDVYFQLTYEFDDHIEVLDTVEIEVIRPLVVLLNWDGVPRVRPDGSLWFHNVLEGTSVLGLMGGDGISNGVEINNMYCTMPSSTFSSHASIYTGQPPGVHGIVSNDFIDRGMGTKAGFGGAALALMYEKRSPLDWYLKGRAPLKYDFYPLLPYKDYHKKSGLKFAESGTFFGQLENMKNGYHTVISGHSMKLGAGHYEEAITLGPLKTKGLDDALVGGLDTGEIDLQSFIKAKNYIHDNYPDLISIYTWNTDHIGHRKYPNNTTSGLEGQDIYIKGRLNIAIRDFWKGIRDDNLMKNVLFILFNDHGRVKVGHALGVSSDIPDFVLDPFKEAEYAENGVMTHVFLGDTTLPGWTVQPAFDDVLDLAKKIFELQGTERAIYMDQIKYILVTDHTGSSSNCSGRYCVAKPDGTTDPISSILGESGISPVLDQLLAGLAGPNSKNGGNMIIVLKSEGTGDPEGYTFGYSSDIFSARSVHGSISKAETNIPFVVFYPGNESLSYNRKTEISEFLSETLDKDCNADGTYCYTTDIMKIVREAVINPNKIYMPSQAGGE